MAISTNSIIHYTDSLDNLKHIIEEGFKIKYCLESLKLKDDFERLVAYPMVCFCDIPFSDIKNHLDSYGYYGIGLSKKWASLNGLNPIIYIEANSNIGTILNRHIGREILDDKQSIDELDYDRTIDYFKICSYLKNYEGPLAKGNKLLENYRFYDEREWRYVPPIEVMGGLSNIIVGETYINNKPKFNKQLNKIKLNFNFDDISYLVVKKEEEISELTKHLRNVYSDKCTATNLEVLLTKIITVNQIISDF
jgi:hypothetical protein